LIPSPSSLIRSLSHPLAPIETGAAPQLPRLSGIRAVAFDIYGTLVVSSSGDIGVGDAEQQESALRSILRDLEIDPPEEHPLLTARFVELIIRDHERSRSLGIKYPEIEVRDIWAQLLARERDDLLESVAIAYECASNPVWPMPGARDLLANLHLRGLTLGIVSNAQFYTPMMVEALFDDGLEHLGFDQELCFFSFQFGEAKPGLSLYGRLRDALARQKISPSEVLYLGNDQLKDIHPAAQLGFRTALFAGDQRSLRLRENEGALNPPDAIITHLSQVLALLE
jgi:putative hydrolase of the HAD superfamily